MALTFLPTAAAAAVANVYGGSGGGGDDPNDARKMLVRRIGLTVFIVAVLVGVIAICCLCSRWCKTRGTRLFRGYVRHDDLPRLVSVSFHRSRAVTVSSKTFYFRSKYCHYSI